MKQTFNPSIHKKLILFFTLLITTHLFAQNKKEGPIKVVVAGISHGHVSWILNRVKDSVIEIVGIYEPSKAIAEKDAIKFNLPANLFFDNLQKALITTKPDAVVAFGSIHEHLKVVKDAAPLHIPIMVEKPLASTQSEVLQMDSIVKKYNVPLLTNFETSWYPSTFEAFRLINDSNYVGQIRKVVFHHGHQGPKEIGVSDEFFNWLTDPIQNGGGAIVDFGCYGANLMTYLMHGEKPISVTAITRKYKPNIYPKVDDDATIIINYKKSQAVLQASWNWPFSRKDMEIYGDSAYIIAVNANKMRLRNKESLPEFEKNITSKDIHVYTDPFSYLNAYLKGNEKIQPYGLYSLENNIMVVKILEAAKQSAKTGKTVLFK
jgi:predicted dehydrogenase